MRKILLRSIVLVLFGFLGGNFAFGQLSGAYTINPLATASATNYQSFTAAAADLNGMTRPDGGPANGPGVSAAVTFTVSPGTYNETMVLNPITGVSATNTVTFDGVSSATRKITTASTTSSGTTIMLNGADYVRIKNLEIENTGSTYGYGVQIVSGADYAEISDCKITLPANASGGYKVGIIMSTYYTTYGFYGSNATIEDNEFVGGRVGIALNGSSTSPTPGNKILNNTFTDFYYAGIYLNYCNDLEISGNDIQAGTVYASAYGMQIRYSNDFVIEKNKVYNVGAYGIYFYQNYCTTTAPGIIQNNMIGGGFKTTGTVYALYFSSCQNLQVYHNSVNANPPNGSGARGFYLTGSSFGNDFRNNSFSATTSAGGASVYAFYSINASYIGTMDYNNYFTNGTNLCYMSGTHATLAALQTAYPAFNANSQDNDPNYVGPTDLHTFGPPLNNWATNIASVTTDIDGQTRPLAPDVVKDVGADELVLAPFDMDINSVVSPLVVATGANTVSFEVMNAGTNSLNGIATTFQYSTNGGTTWSVTESFTPTTLGTSGGTEVFSFTTPWVVTGSGTFNLCIRINPQVTGDPDPSDQICLNVCTGMTGTYTINGGAATGGTNFNTWADAATALGTCGIGGPVTINVAPGTYNEFVTFPAILGASPTNRVTIDGGSVSACTLSHSFTSTNQAIIKMDGTDYMTVKNMTIAAPGTYGYGVHLTNAADNDSLVNLKIELPTTSTSAYHIGVVASGLYYYTYGNNANNLVVMDCDVSGGYYGTRINGASSSSFTVNNKVIDCSFTDFYYYGIYSYYQENPNFIGNYIRERSGRTAGYGIYMYYAEGAYKVNRNEIYNCGTRGMYLNYGNQNRAGRAQVNNNMIGGNWASTIPYGMYLYNTKSTDVIHNSINMCNTNGYALYLSGSSTLTDSARIINNIFKSGSNYSVYITQAYFVTDIDHNMYQSSSPTPFYFGGAYANLPQWQTTYTAYNTGSVFDEPGFVACSDLTVVCSPADNLGEPTYVTVDNGSSPRSGSTPDMGAVEFVSQIVSINLGPDVVNCGRYRLEGDTTNFQTHIWSTGQSSYAIQVDSTEIIDVLVVDSNNCRARDTISITILDRPNEPYSNDTIQICNTTSLDAGNPGSSYAWSTGDTSQTIFTPSPGVYTVDITSIDGCVVSDTVTVDWFAVSAVNLGPDQTFCLGGSATLNAGAQPTGSSFAWNTGANTQVSVVTAPGTYYVQVITPDGCTGEDTIVVNSLLPPVVNLGPDTTLCSQLTLTAANPGASYAWSTGATSQNVNVNTSGSYTVTVTNAAGCTTTDNINVTISNGPSVSLGPDPILCDGQTVQLDAGNPGSTYLWSNGSLAQTITVSSSGTYIVVVTDPATGCEAADTIQVNQSFLNVNLGADQTLCDGNPILLNAGSGATGYLWNTGATSQSLTVSTPGTYSVVVSDASGCNATDSIVINPATAVTAAFNAPPNTPLWQTVNFTDNSTGGATSWFWDFGDGTTSTLQNPTHAFVSMGNFNVCLTVNDGTCDNTVCQNVNVQAPIGIDDELFAQGVNVYPNPNTGLFNISFELEDFETIDVQIYSITGQVVYQQLLHNVMFDRQTVDLTNRPAGIYILKLTTESGMQMVRKLVVE